MDTYVFRNVLLNLFIEYWIVIQESWKSGVYYLTTEQDKVNYCIICFTITCLYSTRCTRKAQLFTLLFIMSIIE